MIREPYHRARLFTHTDLDGISCAIALKHLFPHTEWTISYCNYDQIENELRSFFIDGDPASYDALFITDIGISEEAARAVDHSAISAIHYIDHHDTNKWLNDTYSWAAVIPQYSGKQQSATNLITDRFDHDIEPLTEYVELVRRYDTYEWKQNPEDIVPMELNRLFEILGKHSFVQRFEHDLTVAFSESERALLDYVEQDYQRYFRGKKQDMRATECYDPESGKTYQVGVVFADRHFSILGNDLCVAFPDIDFVLMIQPARFVSMRTTRDDIHLGEIADRWFGGGGHPKAAGGPLHESFYRTIISEAMRFHQLGIMVPPRTGSG